METFLHWHPEDAHTVLVRAVWCLWVVGAKPRLHMLYVCVHHLLREITLLFLEPSNRAGGSEYCATHTHKKALYPARELSHKQRANEGGGKSTGWAITHGRIRRGSSV